MSHKEECKNKNIDQKKDKTGQKTFHEENKPFKCNICDDMIIVQKINHYSNRQKLVVQIEMTLSVQL